MDQDNRFAVPDAGSGPGAELQALERDVETAADLSALKQLFYRLEGISQRYPGDDAVGDQAARIKQRILSKGMQLKQAASTASPATTPLPSPYVTTPQSPPGSGPPRVDAPTATVYGPGTGRPTPPAGESFQPAAPLPAPPAPAAPASAPPRTVAVGPAPTASIPWKRALIAGGLLGVVLFAGMVWTLKRASNSQGGSSTGMVPVQIRTTPAGATIRLNNEVRCTSNCTIELPPGTYQLRATLDGYDAANANVDTQSGSPVNLNLTLNAQGQIVRIFTDLQSGQVTLDDQPAGQLEDGQLILERVPTGRHSVKVSGRGSEASFSFDVIPGAAPVLSGPVSARNVIAILVGSAGDRGKLHSSTAPVKVSLDGAGVGEAGAGGLDLVKLTAGDHELVVDDGKTARKMVVGFGPAPVLTAFLKLDLNAGTLVVVAGEDDATVFLNGKPYTGRKTSRGQLRLRALGVGKYAVRVSKEGFVDEPEQQVEIRKGEESRLEFRLKPVPRMATLRVVGAMPGARVLLDGEALGEVQADGSFSASIAPGAHAVEFRRDGYAPRQVKRQFVAGETAAFRGPEVALEKLPATVRVTAVPSDARLSWRKAGDTQEQPVGQNPLRLPEGTYMITGVAPGYMDSSISVHVTPGENKSVELRLVREKVAAPPPVKVLEMEAWESPGDWKQQDEWLVHTGGNSVLLKPTTVKGTLTFTVAMLKGRRLRWFVNWTDSRSHALFEMDRKNFYRKDVVNGRTYDLSKVEHKLDQSGKYTIQIEVSRGSVIHRVQRGGKWEVVDAWTLAPRDFTRGRFGFLIQGNDQVGLSDFSYRPQ